MAVLQQEAELQERLNQDGYVIFKDLFEPAVVNGVQAALGRYMDRLGAQLLAEGLVEQLYQDEPFETRLSKLVSNCRDRIPLVIREQLHWPEMFGLFFHPRLLDLVGAYLGPEVRLYPNYSVRPKLPEHVKTLVPWHQDAAFTAAGKHGADSNAGGLTADKLRMLNVWSPLVPARPENGCMKFIPGTHKMGVVTHHDTEHYMEIDQANLAPRLKDAIDVILDPGDVVLFNNLLFHTGTPNVSNIVRWSCDWRYQDATQSTLRAQRGHLARSQSSPKSVVHDAAEWARLSFT